VEAWKDGKLVGGFYGVSLGRMFFGESMFHRAPNAAKAAFIPFVWRLEEEGFRLIDSQAHTDYLESLGAQDIPRHQYLSLLGDALVAGDTIKGRWTHAFQDFPRSKKLDALTQGR
jgi:leucyl/phenylalanyl-tRNA--protein transferase